MWVVAHDDQRPARRAKGGQGGNVLQVMVKVLLGALLALPILVVYACLRISAKADEEQCKTEAQILREIREEEL